MAAFVENEEYTKFKQQLLGDVPLGSLSCDELAERIRVWQDEHGDSYKGEYDGEKVAKMKAKVKRQHKSESKAYVREQRGDAPFPVRSEEVQTELSAGCEKEKEEPVPEERSDDEEGPTGEQEIDEELVLIDVDSMLCYAFMNGWLFGVVTSILGISLGLILSGIVLL